MFGFYPCNDPNLYINCFYFQRSLPLIVCGDTIQRGTDYHKSKLLPHNSHPQINPTPAHLKKYYSKKFGGFLEMLYKQICETKTYFEAFFKLSKEESYRDNNPYLYGPRRVKK